MFSDITQRTVNMNIETIMYFRGNTKHQEGSKSVDVFLPENDALQVERVFNDPCGGNANPKHILLGWQIVWFGNTIQIAQIARDGEKEKGRIDKKERE